MYSAGKILFKNIILLMWFILFFSVMNCKQVDEPEEPTKFNNVYKMEAELTGSGSGSKINFYDVPDDAVVLVVGFFDGDFMVDSNNVIVDTSNWKGGTYTGLAGCSRVEASVFYTRDPLTNNFTTTTMIPSSLQKWAVWGYNADWTVICSTSLKTVP